MNCDYLLNGAEVDDDLLEILVGQRRIAPLGWHIHPPGVVRVGRGAAFDEELDEGFVGLTRHERVVVQILTQTRHTLRVLTVADRAGSAELDQTLRSLFRGG